MNFSREWRRRPRHIRHGFSRTTVEQLEPRTMMAADSHVEHLLPPSTNVGALVFTPTNEQGGGEGGGGTTAPVTVPGAPTGLKATAGDGRVALTWTPPTNTGGSTQLCYIVQMSADGGATWTKINRPFYEPRAIIGDLKNGQAYIFEVAAANRAGVGAFSAPSTPVTPVGPTVTLPGAPTGVKAIAADGKAYVTWVAPANAGGATHLGYTIQFSSDGGKTWNTVAPRFEETRAVVPLLTNGTPYVFRVAAFNRAGQGAFSAPSTPVTPTAITLPGAPTGLKAVAGAGKVMLTWTPPSNTGGADRLGYVVQVSSDGGSTWTTITRRFDEPRALILLPANGKSYVFRVAAANRAGQGAFSDPSVAVTPTGNTTGTTVRQ